MGLKCDYCTLKTEIKLRDYHKCNNKPCENCGCLHKVTHGQLYFTYSMFFIAILLKPLDLIASLFKMKKAVLSFTVNEDLEIKTDVKEADIDETLL